MSTKRKSLNQGKSRKPGTSRYGSDDTVGSERTPSAIPPLSEDRIVLPNLPGYEFDKDTMRRLTDGVVEPRKKEFLLYLSVLGNRTRAARAAGIDTATTWWWRKEDDNFRDRYNDCMKIAAELHEDEAFRRASEGVLEPVFHQGEMVGAVRKFSDGLLMFTLRGAMPKKYRDNVKMEHGGEVDFAVKLRAARERVFGRKE